MKNSKEKNLLSQELIPPEDYEKLSFLKQGKATEKVISIISRNNVECGIRVYRIMRIIEKEISPIIRDDLIKASKQLHISNEDLRQLIVVDPKISKRIVYGELIKNEPSRPPDIPIYTLVIYLRAHIKKETSHKHNELICEFLTEQEIKNNLTSDRISKIVRYDLTKLNRIYAFYQETYEASESAMTNLDSLLNFIKNTRRSAVDNPTNERDASLFPPWEDFMPREDDSMPS